MRGQPGPRPLNAERAATTGPRPQLKIGAVSARSSRISHRCPGMTGPRHNPTNGGKAPLNKRQPACANPRKSFTLSCTVPHLSSWMTQVWNRIYAVISITYTACRDGEIGRRSGLKIRRGQKPCGGSIPPPGTITVDLSMCLLGPP